VVETKLLIRWGDGKGKQDVTKTENQKDRMKYGWTRRRSSSRLLMYRNRDKEAETAQKKRLLVIASSNFFNTYFADQSGQWC